MNWLSRQDVEAVLIYNKSIEHILLVRPDLKKYYYILANKVAGIVNMLIQEDGEEFALAFRRAMEPLLVNAKFAIIRRGTGDGLNLFPIWGAIQKKALAYARKNAISKKPDQIKGAIREALKNF